METEWFEVIISNCKILKLKEKDPLCQDAIKYVKTYGTIEQLKELFQIIEKKPE